MRVGEKYKCIKRYPDMSGFGVNLKPDFEEGQYYNIIEVYPYYTDLPYSVVIGVDGLFNTRFQMDEFYDHFISIAEIRKIKLIKINFDNQI